MVVCCIVRIMLEQTNSVTFSRSINKVIRDLITIVNIRTVS